MVQQNPSSRFRYSADWLFSERLGMEVAFDTPPTNHDAADIIINYTDNPYLPGIWMPPCGFFSYEGIQASCVPILEEVVDKCIVFMQRLQAQTQSTVIGIQPFPDLLALAFFALTRYEEYLPHTSDAYGRFPVSQSLWYRKGVVDRALVDELLQRFRFFAISKYENELPQPLVKAEIISTVDIDQAWAYRFKGWRALAGRLKSLDFSGLAEAVQVLFRGGDDPFDTFDTIRDLHRKYQRSCHFFVLAASRRSALDKNHSPLLKPFGQLVGSLSKWASVGVHPSFRSASDAGRITEEKHLVEGMCNQKITHSRQHFLLFRFPYTYRALIQSGIRHDHSMGWAEQTGFRAGTAFSFPWYDLVRDETTTLRIHPFHVMDVTLKNYQRLDIEQALQQTELLLEYAKNFHLPLAVIWHNSSFAHTGEWAGWERVYERILKG